MKFKPSLIFLLLLSFNSLVYAQEVAMSKASLIALTPKWEGERFPDGRPRVSDELLQRLKSITLEQVWSVLKGEGYHHQLEQGWQGFERQLAGYLAELKPLPALARAEQQQEILARWFPAEQWRRVEALTRLQFGEQP